MALSAQKNGPAEAATSPSHGSTNPEGMDMNKDSNTTAAPVAASTFPIPYPGLTPDDDMSMAIRLIDLAAQTLENEKIGSTGGLVFNALCQVRETLRPVQRFLDDLDYKGIVDDYANSRRAVILESWEAAQ